MLSRKHAAQSDDHYQRGLLFYRAGQYEQALAELGQAEAVEGLTGRMASFYRGLSERAIGLRSLREGRFDLAEQHLRAAMDLAGRNAELPAFLAGLRPQAGRAGPHGRAEQVAESPSDGAATCCDLAVVLWRAGRRAPAYMTLTAGIRRLGADARLHLQMGLFLASEERFDEARGAFAAAVEADCTNADARHCLGLTEAAMGDVRAAVGSLQRAFELRGDDLLLAYQLSLAAAAARQAGMRVDIRLPEPRAEAGVSRVEDLARFIASEPDFIDAFLDLPDSVADAELFGALLAAMKTALADHPNHADLHLCCCRVLDRLGQPQEAAAHAEQALRINGRYVQAMLALADLYARLGRTAEAAEHAQRAIENGADWPDAHCLAGELMNRCNRPEEARGHLVRALQLSPDCSRAVRALESQAA